MMLSFQNLHQLVFNLSTSVVSSTYIRLTSTSVKKKPEIDVLCNESFLNTLKALEQSDTTNLFKGLQNVKFGPRFEDMQWIFSKNVNFRFTAGKSVNKSDFYITLDKNDIRDVNLYSLLNKLKINESNKKQKGAVKLERHLFKKSKWNESFISGSSFDENKITSFCANNNNQTILRNNSLLSCSLIGNSYSNSQNCFYLQKRGFKTKRMLELEEKPKSSFFSMFKKNPKNQLEVDELKEKNFRTQVLEHPKLAEVLSNTSTTTPEKLNIKASFVDGYLTAVKDLDLKSNNLKYTTLRKYLLFLIGLAFFAVTFFRDKLIYYSETIKGTKRVLRVSFGRVGEIDPEEINVTFSDVKGVPEVKEELMELVEFLRDPAKFSSLGGKLPKGVLLVGPPGTGKTLLARAVAGEANVPFFHASGAEFDEIFVGEGARRVRNLFRTAKAKAPSIIFIDEIDCVGSTRKSTMLHPYANQTINQLLSEMDGFNKNEGVIVIGATNRKSDLDPALLRPGRFDVEVLVPLPDLEGRKEILELYMSKILCKDIDIERMAKATAGCTGADLEAIINHAAIRAATDEAPYVTMEYLENAKDKIKIGPERKSAMKGDEALMTAYHEGGHAIVAYFTEGADSVGKVTIVPRGETLGHTACVPEEDIHQITKSRCTAQMDVLLGGRAAEELVYGVSKITANASDDLEKATSLASSMVKHFGMSEKIGVRTFKKSEGEIVSVNQFGQTAADLIDLEVKRLVQESYERSKNILRKHAKEHKLLAEALVKYKTLNPEEVKAILGDSAAEKSSPSITALN